MAMVVTFFTRVIPFPLQTRLANSGFLREFSRWMPLGAMVILFAYACSTIPAGRWLPYVVALVVTIRLRFCNTSFRRFNLGGQFAAFVLFFFQ